MCPFKNQKLGIEFYQKEHTKPLFYKNGILTVQNIYNYQCCLNVLKVLKSRTPSAISTKFKLSARNMQNFLILPPANTHDFVYMGSKLWNIIVKKFGIKYIQDIKIGSFKRTVKSSLLAIQNLFDPSDWYLKNFELSTVHNL